MIRPLPLIAAALLLLLGRHVARNSDARRARLSAALWLLVLTAMLIAAQAIASWVAPAEPEALLGLRLEWVSSDWRRTAPVVDLLVALLAVSFAPTASHRPRTLGAILTVIGLAVAFLSFDQPLVLTLLWGASIVVVTRELGRSCGLGQESCVRPFRNYQTAALVPLVLGTAALALGETTVAGILWLLAIAVREAAIPVHGWLPAVAERAPLGLVVALVAPQPGVYSHLSVCGDLTGGQLAHVFAIGAACTGVLAAGLGLVQDSPRRAASWLVISQTGLVAFGLENVSEVGRAGAILSWQVMALATSGFVMTIAALESRRGELSLRRPNGSFERTPRMAVAFFVLGFTSVALPMTLGFVAEDLLVQGSIDEFPAVGAAVVVATALNGINVMRCFFALFSGTRDHVGERDLTKLESTAVTIVLAVLLVGGFAPRLFLPANPPPAAANVDGSH